MSKTKAKRGKKKEEKIDYHKLFKPNVSPKSVFRKGAFGGTYFRTIDSSVTGKTHNGKT